MSEAIQRNNSYDSAGIPSKRKRGRPRKDRSLYHGASVRPREHENLLRIENASVPPGLPLLEGVHVNPVEDASSKVGQAVTGVVESVFDAGYLIAVKIGNSNVTLRGIIFKPGHYAPVTAQNDAAPHLQMIRGNNVTPRRQRRPKARHQWSADYFGNGSSVHPLAANLLSAKDKRTAIVAAPSVPPVGARGTVVPVVLEPSNAVAAQAAHMATSKGKQVQTVTPLSTYDPKEPAPHLSQSQAISNVKPNDVNSKDGPFDHGSLELHKRTADGTMNSMKICLTAEGFEGGSQPSKAQGCSSVPEQETSDINEPLYVEPLRTVHSSHHNQSPFPPNFVGQNGIGRMTELLQAVQDNMKENQLHTEQVPAFPKAEFSEQNEEAVLTQTYFQSPSV
ncbi:AT hook, DNA-binding motif-containing protein [Heracleum sosnowskyi]|uniref:AT hook, DNA-binding motif-containing protein n=1 Tax=Heracleum sosnowskyi TaxID=360622 RepID=A0AAD8IVB2_9APIA|nr:AT hook, DNA-binding motif-containing protein [Heracleum sosnowskyi]